MPKARYDLVTLPGDGIGVEVIAEATTLVTEVGAALGVAFQIDEVPCGGRFYLEHGARDWPEDAEDRCRAADAILLGAVGWTGPNGAPVAMADGKIRVGEALRHFRGVLTGVPVYEGSTDPLLGTERRR